MAEQSLAQVIKYPGDTVMATVRGKLHHYDISKSCYDTALKERQAAGEQFEAAASRLIQADAEWQKWKAECSKVSDELYSSKKLSPEAAPLLADFTPFEDVPLTATAAIVPLPDVSSELLQLTAGISITQKLLTAAYSVADLERRNELLQVLMREKTDEVERLKQELEHSKTDVQLQIEKISQLNAEIAKLKASMSPVGSSTALSPTGEPQLTTPFSSLTTADDVALDPAAMQDRMKELRNRISELVNHNLQWKQQCDELMRDLEAAKRELSECQQSSERMLHEEREKTNRAEAERDEALEKYRHLAEVEVPRLESIVRMLEEQQYHLYSGQHGLVAGALSSSADEEMKSELMATREQAEEYRLGLEEEQERHERTKANVQSLKQQWQDMYHELQAKRKELNKAKAELERLEKGRQRCHNLLEQATSERELIRGSMSPGETGPRDSKSSGQPAQSVGSSQKTKPKRSTLEEDTPHPVIGGYSEKSDRWTCDVCSCYNTGYESLNECKVCKSKKGRVVSYPVQESQTPSAYNQQAMLTSRQTVIGTSIPNSNIPSSSSISSKVGRSRLEEDGAPSCLLHVVL